MSPFTNFGFKRGMEGTPSPPLEDEMFSQTFRAILTAKRRLVALLAGHPEGNDWPSVHQEAVEALEEARCHCTISLNRYRHRRGQF